MAIGHQIKNEYQKALEYHKKTFKIKLKLLGEEHVETATNYNNIGSVYESMNEFPKAL